MATPIKDNNIRIALAVCGWGIVMVGCMVCLIFLWFKSGLVK